MRTHVAGRGGVETEVATEGAGVDGGDEAGAVMEEAVGGAQDVRACDGGDGQSSRQRAAVRDVEAVEGGVGGGG